MRRERERTLIFMLLARAITVRAFLELECSTEFITLDL